ncbi:hypothetical protein ACFO9Q_10475 [Paenibacillus sp. GCM10023252]|uniref:hypothetical protein n=1 Tax=Paenibacillus sp. GCM10023252 TaxID=3252649 RepID=UPI00360B7F98
MEAHVVTCSSVGVYAHALTRGKPYEVLKIDDYKYRITGDHGKRVWIHRGHFMEGTVPIPSLVRWQFDDDVDDKLDFIDISMEFSDGSKRWSMVTTPEKLLKYFAYPDKVGFHLENLINMKTLDQPVVDEILRELEQNDELNKASKPLECYPEDGFVSSP